MDPLFSAGARIGGYLILAGNDWGGVCDDMELLFSAGTCIKGLGLFWRSVFCCGNRRPQTFQI